MHMINETIKYILESNIINFCLMVLFLVWVCKKINVKSAFNNSIKAIEDYIEKSKIEKQNSDKLVQESKQLISHLSQDIESIEKINKQKSDTFKTQLEKNEQKNILKISNEIGNKKNIDEKNATNSVIAYSFGKSLAKAQDDIIEKIKSKPELQYKFIDKSLEELERIHL